MRPQRGTADKGADLDTPPGGSVGDATAARRVRPPQRSQQWNGSGRFAPGFVANDPYRKAGVFGSVTITPWRKTLPK
jgi:hypothetical protein